MMLWYTFTISTGDINGDVNCLRTVHNLLHHAFKYCNKTNCVAAPKYKLGRHCIQYTVMVHHLYILTYVIKKKKKYVSYPANCVFWIGSPISTPKNYTFYIENKRSRNNGSRSYTFLRPPKVTLVGLSTSCDLLIMFVPIFKIGETLFLKSLFLKVVWEFLVTLIMLSIYLCD